MTLIDKQTWDEVNEKGTRTHLREGALERRVMPVQALDCFTSFLVDANRIVDAIRAMKEPREGPVHPQTGYVHPWLFHHS